MLKIEVTGVNTTKKSSKGNDYVVQEAYIHLPTHKYPVKIEVFAPKGLPPYAAGEYSLAPESFLVGDYGRIEVKPVLTAFVKAK